MAHSNAAQKIQEISESKADTKLAHFAALGGFKDEVFHSQVLVMTYIRSSRTAGGIILAAVTQDEDRFQGKIGLVVGMGPGAFKDDTIARFHGSELKVGDWVMTRPADGMELFYNGCTLRLFQDVNILCKVADPTRYW